MPRKSPVIQDSDRPALLRLLRHIAANDPLTLRDLEDFDSDTFRTSFNGNALLRYAEHPLFQLVKHIDFTSKKNSSTVSMLVRAAEEFLELRPTLLRVAGQKWMSEVQARQENQRALRRAAIEAVVLRAALEDTNNVLMGWDSLAKLIEGMTGDLPGRQPLARLFAWFDSGESPFEVVRKGQRGKFGKSTTLKVTLPETEDWAWATNPVEQHFTREWLAGNEVAYSRLIDDEIERRKSRPERKAKYAAAATIEASLELWGELEGISLSEGGGNPGTVQATSLSRLTIIDEEKNPEQGSTVVTPVHEPEAWYAVRNKLRGQSNPDLSLLTIGLDLSIPAPRQSARAEKTPDPTQTHPQEKILA